MPSQHSLRYALRGPEVAFAIAAGDFAALDEVAGLGCDFWNGANSLIVSVAEGGELPDLEVLLAIRDVEWVYVHDNVCGAGRSALAAEFGTRVRSPWAYGLGHEQHPLNLQPSFRNQGQPGNRPALLVPVYDDEPLQRLARVAFGRVKDADRPAYEAAFELEEHSGTAADFALVDGQVSLLAPLAQSTHLMRAYEQSSPLEVRQLMVLDGTDFQGLVNLWNLRARTAPRPGEPSVVGVPTQALSAPDQLRSLRDWTTGDRGVVKPDVFVLTDGDSQASAATVLDQLGYRVTSDDDAEFTVYVGRVPEERRAPEYAITDAYRLGGHVRRGARTEQLISLEAGQRNAVRFEPRGVPTAQAGGYVTLDLVS